MSPSGIALLWISRLQTGVILHRNRVQDLYNVSVILREGIFFTIELCELGNLDWTAGGMNEGRNEISAHSRAKGLAPLSAEGDRINLGCSGDSFTWFLLVNRTIRSVKRQKEVQLSIFQSVHLRHLCRAIERWSRAETEREDAFAPGDACHARPLKSFPQVASSTLFIRFWLYLLSPGNQDFTLLMT